MNEEHREICRNCRHARDRFGGSCYCIKYGYIIGFSKKECRGYEHHEREQVRKPEVDVGREDV